MCLSSEGCRHLFSTVSYFNRNEKFFFFFFGMCLNQGGKSRDKVVKILVSMTPDEILEKLKKEASS
uniref:Uncharacterized protein n=1 Tax=Dromaius novaehollandiae TaxID=8790 RepID=A0A8C4P4K4_DRONO